VAGRFTLLDRIGAGGSGSVWRAYDQRDRRYCAAKLLRPADTKELLRAVREQAFRIAHPHLLAPYSWVAEDDDVLLAMDLVRGGSLSTLVNDYGRLPAPYAAAILDQLLDALGQVHAAGVVHRDVKPANILLDPTGTGAPYARLADFGIAVDADGARLTSTGFAVGTRGYVAPEVLAGRESGSSQDLYAAGQVARRMLLGAGQADEARPPDVPAALWSLVDALCEYRPADRPESAAVARRQLTACGLVLRLPARTADGDPVEVFDQTGPLPAGWGPDGPAPLQPIQDPAVTAAAAPPLPTPTARPAPTLPEPATVAAPPTLPAPVPPRPALPRPAAAPRTLVRRPAVVLSVAGAVVVAAAGATLAYANRGPDGRPHGDGSTTPSRPSATQSAVPATTQPTRQPLPGISAGGACVWQDVDSKEQLTDGRWVQCKYQPADGSYRWTLLP
jgi:eukaryotic-like serine/threonine-protein kinase